MKLFESKNIPNLYVLVPVYNSPYYNPLLNRRQETGLLPPAQYPDYQFSSGGTGYGAPAAPVITDTVSGYGAPLAPPVTDPPPEYTDYYDNNGYENVYENVYETGSGLEEVTEEESPPEISQ